MPRRSRIARNQDDFIEQISKSEQSVGAILDDLDVTMEEFGEWTIDKDFKERVRLLFRAFEVACKFNVARASFTGSVKLLQNPANPLVFATIRQCRGVEAAIKLYFLICRPRRRPGAKQKKIALPRRLTHPDLALGDADRIVEELSGRPAD